MNDQVRVFIQYVVTGVIAFGVGRHWFTAADATTLSTVLINLLVAAVGAVPTIIGVLKSSKTGKAAAAQASPTEQVYTTDPAVAAAAPGAVLVAKLPPAAPIVPKP